MKAKLFLSIKAAVDYKLQLLEKGYCDVDVYPCWGDIGHYQYFVGYYGDFLTAKRREPKPVWASIAESGKVWSGTPQKYLGVVTWAVAVRYAKSTGRQVRLCTSAGYNNQGHYIDPR